MTVRDFLNAELAKYESWEDAKSANEIISSLCDSQASFGAAKKGVGQSTILKFLGGGPSSLRLSEVSSAKSS